MQTFDSVWITSLIRRQGFTSKEPRPETVQIDVTADLLPSAALDAQGETQDEAKLAQRLQSLLHRDPALFLERYGCLLSSEELAAFDTPTKEYAVGWHLQQLRRTAAEKATVARNRRFRALRELEATGYFEDKRMLEREPDLYKELVGRFCRTEVLPPDTESLLAEAAGLLQEAEGSEAGVALPVDTAARERARRAESAHEAACPAEAAQPMDTGGAQGGAREGGDRLSEGESTDETSGDEARGSCSDSDADADDNTDDDDDDAYTERGLALIEQERRVEQRPAEGSRADAAGRDTLPRGSCRRRSSASKRGRSSASKRSRSAVSDLERQRLREVLLQTMRERFLSGLDAEWFDYSAVDGNDAYDDLEQQARDAEEKYFDESDEEATPAQAQRALRCQQDDTGAGRWDY